MGKFKPFSDGQQWTILDTDDNGVPVGSVLGSFKSQSEADARISEMLADNGVHMGVFNQYASGFKLIQGGKLWVAWYSNAAQDLQKEFFPRKATDKFISLVDRKALPHPELWWFHLKGAKHGDALLLGRVGLMTLGVGGFDDTAIAEKFKSYYVANKQELSHGFYYDPRQFIDGAYNSYYTFEITTLPPGNAANPFTSFEVFDMFNAEKIKALESIVGSADAELILTNSAEASKQIAAMGAKFKAFAADDPAEPDKDDKKPATPPAAEKAIDVRIGAIETAVTQGFKTFAGQLAPVFTSLSETLAAHQKATTDLTTKVDKVESGLKAVVQFIKDEYAMQPPATQSPVTVPPPGDPGMNFMQLMQQQAQGQQAGAKGNNPLGLFADVFGALGVGGKAMPQSPFEIPGAYGTPATPAPQPQAQQQGQPAPLQFPGMNGAQTPPPNMQGFVNALIQPNGNGNQPNQQPGVGIPRLGQ